LEIHPYIKARALQHIHDSDLCNLFKTCNVINTEYSQCVETI